MSDFQINRNNKVLSKMIDHLDLRFPVAELSRKTGEGKGNISSFMHGKKPVSDNFIGKMESAFEINRADFGDVRADKSPRSITPKNGLTFTELENGQYCVSVPLIPFSAHAQYISESGQEDLSNDYEEVSFFVDKVGFGNYRAFKVKGDSMDGGIINDTRDGAIVLARELQKHHWRDGFYPTDYGWIIITHQNILFKDIVGFDAENGTITCHSRNTSPEYSDFELELDEVHQIYKVIKRTF